MTRALATDHLVSAGVFPCRQLRGRRTKACRSTDAEESDVFILSGAEDLVPAFKRNPDRSFVRDAQGHLVNDEESREGYMVKRYRPRIEGLFAHIERWTRISDGETTPQFGAG